jgi:glycerol-3-phosphate dehydrogenase
MPGSFADKVRKLDDPREQNRMLLVAGTHLLFPKKFSDKKYGMIIPETNDGRVMFILPWLDSTLVGTTEKTHDEPSISPAASFEEL